MLQIARSRRERGGGVSDLELTDPLICDPAFFVHISKHRSITLVQLVNYPVTDYPELDPKIIRRIVNMRIKGYSQLIDIVNFCGKQGNISSSKKSTWLWSIVSGQMSLVSLQDQVITFVYHKAFRSIFSHTSKYTCHVETIFIVSSMVH